MEVKGKESMEVLRELGFGGLWGSGICFMDEDEGIWEVFVTIDIRRIIILLLNYPSACNKLQRSPRSLIHSSF